MEESKIYYSQERNIFLKSINTASFSSVFLLTDEICKPNCLPVFRLKFPELYINKVMVVKAGERHKTLGDLEVVWDVLLQEADRQSLLINLGGGVITDMGGFAASVVKRGIAFVNIPTSLLAMVDASVGMKTGVNFKGAKNQIGLFASAYGTYIDADFLTTLPRKELNSGFAEMLKIAAVSNLDLWQKLMNINEIHLDVDEELIRNSVESKLNIVAADPHEQGKRKLLNFGHTIGHALETFSIKHDVHPLSHGAAVAVGMKVESWLAHEIGIMKLYDFEEINKVIDAHFELYPLPENSLDEVISYMKWDKKNHNNNINFTFVTSLGSGVYDEFPAVELIKKSLKYYISL